MEKLARIEDIVDMEIMQYIDKKLKGKAVLGGRRALALAGITFRRPFTSESDHDFVIKHLSMRHTLFGDGTFKRAKIDGPYGHTDDEEIEGREHYRFYHKTENCLFVNKDLITTKYRGIIIADPEQILFYKKKYVIHSPKHKTDFEKMSRLHYTLGHL